MTNFETHFYGKLENIYNLKADLDYCTEGKKKASLKELLDRAEFDYDGYTDNPKTENIDIKNWSFKNDSKMHTESRTVKVTFQSNSNKYNNMDYKPLLLLSKIYGVNYRSCTKAEPATKSTNVSFEEKDYEILEMNNPYREKTYKSVIFGTDKRRKEVIDNIMYYQKRNTSYSTKKLIDCSNDQLITGVYYDTNE